jgi:hypothetical protein
MKIYAGRKRSEYPPIPTKPINHSDPIFNCPSFELLSDSEDRQPITVYVLKSRNQAKQFIMSLLAEYDFPPAKADQYQLEEYRADKSRYVEDMEFSRESFDGQWPWLNQSEGQQLAFVNSSGWHVYDIGDFDEALDAYRNANNIECLIYEDSYGYVIFNAFMVWEQYEKDDEVGTWFAEDDSSVETRLWTGSYNDYEWIKVNGSEIMMPPWATKKSDFMK